MRHVSLGPLAVAVMLLAAATGCDRRPRLVPASADSLAAGDAQGGPFGRGGRAVDRGSSA